MKTSDEFWRAIVWGGTVEAFCEGCKTTYLAGDGDLEPGEREAFEANVAADPSRFVLENCGTITKGDVNGQSIVIGCEKCDAKVRKIEDWIWAHRDTIGKYLRARREAELTAAQSELEKQCRDVEQ